MTAALPIQVLERGKHAKAQRRLALIEAGTAVFAEKGYDAATTREVAERAVCSEGLIHRYFGGKRGLLLAILQQKGATISELMRAEIAESDDLRTELHDIMRHALTFMWEQRDFMRVSSTRAIIDPEVARVISTSINDGRVALVRERLARHQAAGRIRNAVDIQAIAESIAGIGFESGFFWQVVFAKGHDAVHQMVQEFVEIVARGLEPCSKHK